MAAIQEGVRVAERVLDHQLSSLQAERADLERLARTGMATLAGVIAVAGLLAQGDLALPGHVVAVLAAGVAALAAATGLATVAAPPSEVTVGPSLTGLYQALGDDAWNESELGRALLEHAAKAERYNAQGLERAARRRMRATWLLLVGATMVLAALVYLVGGAIHG